MCVCVFGFYHFYSVRNYLQADIEKFFSFETTGHVYDLRFTCKHNVVDASCMS